MNDLEGLIIYKQYFELIYYTDFITMKYPKSVKLSLVTEIKNVTYDGMRKIILANKEYNKDKRVAILNEIDVDLKMIKVMVRLSYRNRYINKGNYKAWCRKLTNIGNLLGGWINSCLR